MPQKARLSRAFLCLRSVICGRNFDPVSATLIRSTLDTALSSMKHALRYCTLVLTIGLLGAASIATAATEQKADTEDQTDSLETIYVTDVLHLKLFEEPGGKGATLKTLSSGNALRLLETKGRYHKVETVDGVVGWVKKFYTVSEPPAAVALPEIQKLLEERDAEVERLKQKLEEKAVGAGLRADYEDKLIQLNAENVELLNEKERLRKKLDQLELERLHNGADSAENTGSALPRSLHPAMIAAITGFAGLLLGTLFGYRLYANRLKKRFYGRKL